MYQKEILNYGYNGLEPYISASTIDVHYNKHYLGYLNKLNNLLNDEGYKYEYIKEDLVNHIDMFHISKRDGILYTLGGVLNHELYFDSMSSLKNNIPTGNLKIAIDKEYGNFDNFKDQFIKIANEMVGSGYTFLVVNKEKKLEILNFSNQDTPYSYGLVPILALDLWEHAYYLDYLNDRASYIKNFFQIIDFDKVNNKYEKITKA